jgi:hypothetical protein
MAKKKKQKKTGLQKRKQVKQQKRKARVQKVSTQKPSQKKLSMSKAKKFLAQVPKLVFEPELVDYAYSQDVLDEVAKTHEKVPDQIEAATTSDFLGELINRMKVLEQRVLTEQDEGKHLMAKAMLYYMESDQAPSYFNQLIVALYLRSSAKEGDEVFTEENIINAVDLYEEKWSEYLSTKSEGMDEGAGVLPETEYDDFEDIIEENASFSGFLSEFEIYHTDILSTESSVQERIVEDAEAFLNDYLEEKEVTSLDQIEGSIIHSFLATWFIQTMNATKEDMESMLVSLQSCFDFAKSSNQITEEKYQDVLRVLEKKETYLNLLG